MVLTTPTQFLYQAAMATRKVPVAMKKVVEYEDVESVDTDEERCWLCGGPTHGKGQPVKKAIKVTFTDRDRAQVPESSFVCTGCFFCLSFRSLRNYSICVTKDELRHPDRPTLRELLINPPDPPFLLLIATSGQKWLHFKGELAYGRDGYPVQYEDTRMYVDRKQLAAMLEVVEELYTTFTKSEMLSGDYSQNRIRSFGRLRFQELEREAATYRGTRLFDLAVFVAQKREGIPAPEPEKKRRK